MSRARRKTIVTLLMVFLAVLVWLDRGRFASTTADSSGPNAAGDMARYHGRRFPVAKVVDGDTLDIDIPDGDRDTTRIRLWGVDCPESVNPNTGPMYFGGEASEFAKQLAHGETVTVFLDEGNNTRGKYGRLLAYVQLPDSRFLNELLLSEGYAYADVRFRHSRYARYKQLEATARSAGKGLWAAVTRDQLPKWLQQRNPTLLLDK